MKYAIISTDANPDYFSLVPLACHSWNKIGYRPAVLTIGDVPEVIKSFCDADFMPLRQTPLVKDSTIAQLFRLFACQSPMFGDNDVIITSDSDMIIAKDIFNCNDGFTNYGYDLTGRSELPICYNIATAAKWRELMGEFHIPDAAYSDQWEMYWSTDQQLLTKRAHEYGMGRIMFVDRGNQNKHGLPTGRWDRYDWSNIPDTIIDVHMPRNNWDAQYQVAERLWPGEDHSFITKFREALEGRDIGNVDLSVSANINELIERPVRIDIPDEHRFLNITGNWDNHRSLLLLGLSLTQGLVIEFGSGEGSTPYLREYCKKSGRHFESWESNKGWAEKTGSNYTSSWELPSVYRECGLFFCDHAPGEHRKVAIERMMDKADIICVHDTEIGGAGDYGFEPVFAKFKYRLNYNKMGGGAGATLVSNKIDVNRFRGLSLGPYTFDND